MGVDQHELVARLAEALARRPEVLDAYLFGSAGRGEAQPHSDLDVAVYVASGAAGPGAAEAPFGLAADITADLLSALGDNRVEVVLLNRAPPLLYHRVIRDGVRLVSRDVRATTVREGRALSRYCDYVVQLAKIDRATHGRIARGDFGR